jgi:TM2 domain-containing membrane protein YozV
MTTPPPQDPNYGSNQPPQYGQQPGYPQQQPGYPQQQPGYPQQGGYPPQQGGYAPVPTGPHGSPYGVDPVTGEPLSDKTKMVAGLLQILLGGFGAGRFYTGHTGLAVGQIAATWLTCGIGGIWPLVDGIMILVNGGTDAQGRKLRDS